MAKCLKNDNCKDLKQVDTYTLLVGFKFVYQL